MSALEINRGRYITRDPVLRRKYHPLDPTCPMHLRRICGTCANFPPDADMRAKAQICSRFMVLVNGTRCAGNCKMWARKGGSINQIKPKEKQNGIR